MNHAEFAHVIRPGTLPGLLLLHGTGGNEHDLLPLGDRLAPGAAILSPRGRVSERGAPRFFRRFAEGVLDVEDWRVRANELADFVAAMAERHRLGRLLAVGYSNGANIAQGLLLLRPGVLRGAVLMRPMFVTDDVPETDLTGLTVLLLAGRQDPFMRPGDADRITHQLALRGALVLTHLLPAGHDLTAEDLRQAAAWIRSDPSQAPMPPVR